MLGLFSFTNQNPNLDKRDREYDNGVIQSIKDDPSRLEFGLLPYPSDHVQTHPKNSCSEALTLLIDKNSLPVLVLCVNQRPTVDALKKIRRRMSLLKSELGVVPRGILVYGGMRLFGDDYRVAHNLINMSIEDPPVEIIHYELAFGFERQTHRYPKPDFDSVE